MVQTLLRHVQPVRYVPASPERKPGMRSACTHANSPCFPDASQREPCAQSHHANLMQIRVAGHRLRQNQGINITKGKKMTKKLAALTLSTALGRAGRPRFGPVARVTGPWVSVLATWTRNPTTARWPVASATIDADTRPIFTAEYFVRDNLGIELLAATPFKHDHHPERQYGRGQRSSTCRPPCR